MKMMNKYDVILKIKNGREKKIKVGADSLERAKKIALYWEEDTTIIEKIDKIN